ncbi:MAG: hypothetical protein KJZ91_01465 [Myxococcales bacterium]|nr:hypothetical protein [Myxococcales bacterium]
MSISTDLALVAAGASGAWLAHRYLVPGLVGGATTRPNDAHEPTSSTAPTSSTPTDALSTTTADAPTRPAKGLSRAFDPIFREHGRGLPLAYLRALAWGESRFTPSARGGLITVVDIVRRDYNQRHGTSYSAIDLNNPTTNVVIAADTIRRIVDSYARNHPDVPALREDWNARPYLHAVTFGWNAGYSESGGVGRVVRYLVERGDREITLDKLHEHAHAAGASHWLWAHPKKVAWCRSVVDLYFAQLEIDGASAGRAHERAQAAGGAR